jgi:Fe-S-cluster containining protein
MKRDKIRHEKITAAVAEVRAIYREVDARPIERNCMRRRECCQFRLTGRTPYLTRGEAFTAAKALRSTGRTQMPARFDGSCPLLDAATGNCMIYADRPFGCRTHFCSAAGGPYARREVADLIQRLERIDSELGGDGGHPLASALEDALQQLR